jgi:CRP-like cAMP-binding protein
LQSNRKSDILLSMNWTSIIQDLLDAGMTQAQIADACDTGQSHVSGLLRGDRKQPGWSLGDRLIALHRERCGKAAA